MSDSQSVFLKSTTEHMTKQGTLASRIYLFMSHFKANVSNLEFAKVISAIRQTQRHIGLGDDTYKLAFF